MFGIGMVEDSNTVTLDVDGHPVDFRIGNYSDNREELDKLIANADYGGICCALFRFNPQDHPQDQFAYFVPLSDVVRAFEAERRVHDSFLDLIRP